MKLSLSTKISEIYRKLGVSSRAPLGKSFPSAVHPDYQPVFDEFIRTRYVLDLYRALPKETAKCTVLLAFASYIQGVSAKAVPKINLPELSLQFFDTQSGYRKINEYLLRKRIPDTLKLRRYSQSFDINAVQSDWLNALLFPVVSGRAVYKVQGREPFDKLIHGLVPTLFSSVPYEFRREVNGKKRPVLRTEEQLKASSGWVTLLHQDGVKLSMARAQFSTVLLTYEIRTNLVAFHGKNAISNVEKAIRKQNERSIVLP